MNVGEEITSSPTVELENLKETNSPSMNLKPVSFFANGHDKRHRDFIGTASWMPRVSKSLPVVINSFPLSDSPKRLKYTIPTDPSDPLKGSKTINHAAEIRVHHAEIENNWHLQEVSKRIEELRHEKKIEAPELHPSVVEKHFSAYTTKSPSPKKFLAAHSALWDKYDSKKDEIYTGRGTWLATANDPNSAFYGRIRR